MYKNYILHFEPISILTRVYHEHKYAYNVCEQHKIITNWLLLFCWSLFNVVELHQQAD